MNFLGFNFNPHFHFSWLHKTDADLSRLHRDAISAFQMDFIDYSLVASTRHKNLRINVPEDWKDGDRLSQEQIDEIKSNLLGLLHYCNGRLFKSFDIAAKYLKEYFIHHEHTVNNALPRICVKVLRDNQISDLYRDHGKKITKPFPISANTGFSKIHEDGQIYLCNNIPENAKKERYQNMRLDQRSVQDYVPLGKLKLKWKYRNGDYDDVAWERCWDVGQRERPEPEQCYKSTLIAPLALKRGQVSQDLADILHLRGNFETSTYGFLCFDHRAIDFFTETDKCISAYFADILSLYVINHINYVGNSKTVNRALQILNLTINDNNYLLEAARLSSLPDSTAQGD